MDKRDLVIILSDIHMGTNVPAARYRKEVHEKYLTAILEDIAACANQIQEVILLGDIFELWFYHPDELPPTIDDIIEAHPDILGPNGKLRQVLSSLEGRIVYIPGDHDMNLTPADLNKIKSSDGYTMKYHSGAYIPLYDTGILFTHGHESALLNAPYFESQLAPLPIGYFLNRAIAYKVQNVLNKKAGAICDNLKNYGLYDLSDFISELSYLFTNCDNSSDFISGLLETVSYVTGIPKDLQIRINNTTSVSFNDIKKIYQYLVYDFYNYIKRLGFYKQPILFHDLLLDINGTYLPLGMKNNLAGSIIDTVVMGHKHAPVKVCRNNKIRYENTSSMCPAVSDLQSEPITYGLYSISNRFYHSLKITDTIPVHIESDGNTIRANQNMMNPDNGFTFGFSVFDASLEFWQMMQMGVLSKAMELGINIITHDQKSSTIEMIIGNIDLISKGIDALLIAPYNPEGLPLIVADADRNQIPVVALDIGTGGADVAAFIVSDSFGGGIYAGEYALTLIEKYSLQSKNTAIIKVQQTAKYALLRGEGFKRVMLENGYQVVAEIPAESQENLAYEVMKNILAIYGNDLAVVFCENGTMALGAARAIDEAGEKGKIMLIGFDSGPSIIAAIKNGSMQGTIAQEPFLMGETGVEVANSVLLGIPVTYDDTREKIILMEVYLVNENGEAVRSIT